MGKRGQLLSDTLDWFVALGVTFFIIFVFAFIAINYDREVVTKGIDPYVYLGKLHYGDLIYASDPDTGLLMTGVVDEEKLASLEENNKYVTPYFGAKLTLYDEGMNNPREFYNNKNTYTDNYGIAVQNLIGPGGASLHEYMIPVAIQSGSSSERAYLHISYVRLNS